jgi:hypothetical protein
MYSNLHFILASYTDFSHANEFDEESPTKWSVEAVSFEQFTIHGIRDLPHHSRLNFRTNKATDTTKKEDSVYYDNNPLQRCDRWNKSTMDEEVLKHSFEEKYP